MSIRLIEYDPIAKTVKITEHCYTISWLNRLLEIYPDDQIKVMAYIFYMSCPNPENPYFNIREMDREERILRDVQPEFDREDKSILLAIDKLTELYTTPATRAYDAIAGMVDNLYDYISDVQFKDGKDGNVATLMNILKNFKQMRESYNEVNQEVAEETIKARGKSKLPYDQR